MVIRSMLSPVRRCTSSPTRRFISGERNRHHHRDRLRVQKYKGIEVAFGLKQILDLRFPGNPVNERLQLKLGFFLRPWVCTS